MRPVAIGVLPFKPGTAAGMVIPQVTIGKGPDGHRWITTVGDSAEQVWPFPRRPGAGRFVQRDVLASRSSTTSLPSPQLAMRWPTAISTRPSSPATSSSSPIDPLDVHAILLRLRASFGSSYRYSVDGFIGASPELLVARHGDIVRSHPLAGTRPARR